jgi:hypothetical protein
MGRDKGKFNKRGGRGGGKRFQATSAEEIEQRNNRIAEFDERRAERRAEEDDEEEAGVEEEVQKLSLNQQAEKSSNEAQPMTRKQREEADKARKAAEYRRRHELGLTEEYKRDMEKLAEVKRRRAEANKKIAEEKEMQAASEEERKSKLMAAQADVGSDDDDDDDKKKKKSSKKSKKKEGIPKIDKITMKKMKPAQLKEALKARGLDIQGNAKALLKRLADHEASR